ncbi:MAG TPA: hypothetical protein PKO06_24645, partial [Candidatus Ozemobacteraceae bacterium]|nr:hypothetical protein [Candidatus Ozemobacteraceae bacterium]
MKPAPPSLARTALFLASVVLLLLPAVICQQALQKTEEQLSSQAAADALSNSWDMLKLLRLNSLPRLLLEERLDGIVERIADTYTDNHSGTELGRLQQAVHDTLSHEFLGITTTSSLPLDGEATPPASGSVFMALGVWGFQTEGASSSRVIPLVYSGLPKEYMSLFNQMMYLCIICNLGTADTVRVVSAADDLLEKIRPVIGGLYQGMYHVAYFLRGSIIPGTFQGRDCWLFWQILHNH